MNNNEYEADLITLLDDENVEHTFEIIDSIEKDGVRVTEILNDMLKSNS